MKNLSNDDYILSFKGPFADFLDVQRANELKKYHYFYVCNKMKRTNYTNSLRKKILFIRPKMQILFININNLMIG